MKVLYVYDEMPKTYQNYLWLTLRALIDEISLKTLSYKEDGADFFGNETNLAKKVSNKLTKFGLSKSQRSDLEVMNNFDIVHLQHSYLFSKISELLTIPSHQRPKIIITLRGADTYVKPWVYKKWQQFYKEQAHLVDAFAVVSKHQKEYLQKWGVAADKIHVVPVSFGEATHSSPKSPSDGVMKVMSAHRMTWEKNIDGNLRTIKAIKEAGIPVQYDVYGDGPDLGQLYYLIDAYNLGDTVNCLEKVDNNELKKRLGNYDFFLQLSMSESLGVSVLEAQAHGVPAIVSNRGGLPETIVDGASGFSVAPHENEQAAKSMMGLFADKEKYQSFSETAIKHVHSNYAVANETALLVKLYHQLLNS